MELYLTSTLKCRHTASAIKTKLYKTPWPESPSELYGPRDRRLMAKLVLSFADHTPTVTRYSLVDHDRHYGGICCHRLQRKTVVTSVALYQTIRLHAPEDSNYQSLPSSNSNITRIKHKTPIHINIYTHK
jgi:hypothetical protein